MEITPGTIIDRYTVEALRGSGGMAKVYRVRHNQLGSVHALKVLTNANDSVRRRLVAEGRSQSTLQHPNVVSVTDLIDVDNAPGLIMEYVWGPTLRQLLDKHRPTHRQADKLGRGILRGVAAAHRHGLIHRDIKPANILLQWQGDELVPKIADFGLAKVLVEPEKGPYTTHSGAILGTPAYMAPEQFRDASSVDQRADIFALGTVLYELVAGSRPFGGSNMMEMFESVCAGEFILPEKIVKNLRPGVRNAIVQALATEPDRRHQTVDDFLINWTEGTTDLMLEEELSDTEKWTEDVISLGDDDDTRGTLIAQSEDYKRTRQQAPVQDTITPSMLGSGTSTITRRVNETIIPDSETIISLEASQKENRWLRTVLLALLLIATVGALIWYQNDDRSGATSTDTQGIGFHLSVDDPVVQRRFDEAIEALYTAEFVTASQLNDRVLIAYPNQPAPHLVKALLAVLESGRPIDFVHHTNQARTLGDPDNPSSKLADLAYRTVLEMGHYQGVLSDMLVWYDQYPDDYPSYLATTVMLQSNLKREEVEALHQGLIQLGADKALTHIIIAAYWSKQKHQTVESRQYVDQSLEAAFQLNPHSAYLHFMNGSKHRKRGEYEQAKDAFTRALHVDAAFTRARIALVETLLYSYQEEMRIEQVRILLDPTSSALDDSNFLYDHGKALWMMGRLEEAFKLWELNSEKAIEKDEYTRAATSLLATAYFTAFMDDVEASKIALSAAQAVISQPEIPTEAREGFATLGLYIEGLIQASQGELEQLDHTIVRLKAMPENRFRLKWTKDEMLAKLTILQLAETQDWEGVLQAAPAANVEYEWTATLEAKALLMLYGRERAMLRLTRPLPKEQDELHEKGFLPHVPKQLVMLARLQLESGDLEDARESLNRFDGYWPHADENLPLVKEARRLRNVMDLNSLPIE